jgi:hypothetical protein
MDTCEHNSRLSRARGRACAVGGVVDDVKGRGHGHMRTKLTTEQSKGSGMRSRKCPRGCVVSRSASNERHQFENHDNLNELTDDMLKILQNSFLINYFLNSITLGNIF